MKKKLLMLGIISSLLFYIHGIGQTQLVDPCDEAPSSSITSQEAQNRINLFEDRKKSVIQKRGVNSQYITIQRDNILDILSFLKKNNYDGLRFYLSVRNKQGAVPAKLSFILIPTINSGIFDDDNRTISDDDEIYAYVSDEKEKFNQKNLSVDPRDFRQHTRFVKLIVPKLEADHLLHDIRKKETHSLWYSDTVLFRDEQYHGDLLSYITACTDIKEVRVHFASFTTSASYPANTKFRNQIDLIFEFPDLPEKQKYFTLGASEINKNYLDALKFKEESKRLNIQIQSLYTDTGLPCPPAKCPTN